MVKAFIQPQFLVVKIPISEKNYYEGNNQNFSAY